MNTANASEMNELDELIQKLHDEKRELHEQIREIEEKKECNTEKQIYLRNIRHKKLEVTKELCEALERRSQREYDSIYNKKIQERKIKADTEVNTIFGTTTDTLKPEKENEKTFIRNFNMFGKYKNTINDLRSEIKELMKRGPSEMTQESIDDRDLSIQAKISTMKTIAKEYEKHYHNLTMV